MNKTNEDAENATININILSDIECESDCLCPWVKSKKKKKHKKKKDE